VEVGDWADSALRRVDLLAADQWLTCDDNLVFVTQFRSAVADTADWVRSGHGSPLPIAGMSPAAVHRRLLAGIRDGVDDYWQFQPFYRWGAHYRQPGDLPVPRRGPSGHHVAVLA
jgi:hypothetical protein